MNSHLREVENLFFNSDVGLLSFNRLFNRVKENKIKITRGELKKWYDKQDINQIFINKTPTFYKIKCPWGLGCLQADLMDISKFSRHNSGNKFILNVIDIFSRYVWSFPIRNKSPVNIKNSFEEIFKILVNKKRPISLTTDTGNEFKGGLSRIYKQYKVMRFTVNNKTKIDENPTLTAIVERFNRTMWSFIKRYSQRNNTLSFVSGLKSFVKLYNNTIHSSTGKKPIDVFEKGILPKKPEEIIVDNDDFEIGDIVRTRLKQGKFAKKSFEATFSRQKYEIIEKIRNRFKLKNVETGHVLKLLYLPRNLFKTDLKQSTNQKPKSNNPPKRRNLTNKINIEKQLNEIRTEQSFKRNLGRQFQITPGHEVEKIDNVKRKVTLKPRMQPKRTKRVASNPQLKVGRRVAVFWDDHNKFERGTLIKYDKTKKMWIIRYDFLKKRGSSDPDVWEDLLTEKFKFI